MVARGPALEGTLADLPLPELLGLLRTSAKTGLIEVLGGHGGRLAIRDGEITFGESNNGPGLEQLLAGAEAATPATWASAEAHAARGGSVLDGLVSEGVADDVLRGLVREQAVSAVFELLLPSDAPFEFFADQRPEVGDRYRFDVGDLLAEATERVEAWTVIAEAIPTTSMTVRLSPRLPTAEVTITADDWRVLSRVDGRSTIADIIRELGMSAFAVCAVLHQLIGQGAIEPADESPTPDLGRG